MRKNSTLIGVNYRKRPVESELWETDHTTGKRCLRTFDCPCCGETKILSEAYYVKYNENIPSHQNKELFSIYDENLDMLVLHIRKETCVICWNKDTSERNKRMAYHIKDRVKRKEAREKYAVENRTSYGFDI